MRALLIISLLSVCVSAYCQKLSVYDLTTDHKTNPIGIDNKTPRLSWKIRGEGNDIMQQSYQIRVATSPDFKNNSIVWESGKINSDQSILVSYEGQPLTSSNKYFWQVKISDNKKRESAWSQAAFWEMGFLSPSDWKASWIEPQQDTVEKIPAIFLRKEFNSKKTIQRARAYVTSHGLYELHLNGKKVGDQVLTPGWTAYNERLQYQVYDVTSMMAPGQNVVGAILGDGWYRGKLGWVANWGVYGKTLGLLCQIIITYSDGTQDMIITDESWKSTNDGPIVMNSIYDGETYDARKEIEGWNKTGFDESKWKPVKVTQHSKDILVAMETVPVQKISEIKPVKIFKTPKGTLVVDMGQNMVGWIRLKAKATAGTTVTIRHAEVLDKFGEFYTENMRAAQTTMKYTFKGSTTEEIYEPRFTFFGFRYISVEGFPGEIKPENVTGVVVHSNMEPSGTFECSNPLVNQLQHNIQWGQKGNFVDVPTDCPQRDERLGWTGDAQAFCRTAAFNMNVAPFFAKWLKDLDADQLEDGRVPFVIPNVLGKELPTSAGWGDVATIAPWTLYQVYGDKKFLEDQYSSMKKYVDFIRSKAGDSYIWKGGSIFGDWLYYKPEMTSHTEPDGYTSPDMIATMFFAYSSKLLAITAKELGKTEDEKFYTNVFNKVKETFNKEYVSPSGRIASDSQTAYVLALMFELLPAELRDDAVQHLVNDIRARRNHLSTGFLGTPYLCHVLSDNGKADVAYDLLLQETFPSWLFPVKMGATTIWERWDGQKPDSTFQDKGMNSFNHYAYGAVGDWMYRVVAGIEIGSPGYKQIKIQPVPDKRLTFAKASYESMYGAISSGWELKDGKLNVNITIPANTRAVVTLPDTDVLKVTYNGSAINAGKIKTFSNENGDVRLELGSGVHNFSYPYVEKDAKTQ
jgi:alpha-L-rhamnosidase